MSWSSSSGHRFLVIAGHRDYAMHADWKKLTPESVGGMIGFVEAFLLNNF